MKTAPIFWFWLAALAVFAGLASRARAEEDGHALDFANGLLAEGDYYRAITEYKRFLHLHPTDPAAEAVHYAIGLAYFRGGQWEAAVTAFQALPPAAAEPSPWNLRAQAMIGESFYRNADYPLALDAFVAFAHSHPAADFAADADMRAGQCLFLLGKTPLAMAGAERLARQTFADERTADFSRGMAEASRMPLKSPKLAGALSAVLPGAGQLYVGRPRDAGISFLLNGGLIALAVLAFDHDEPVAGGLLAAVELSWYAGNVYGAANGAHKCNRAGKQRFMERLEVECGIMRGADAALLPAAAAGLRF